MADFPGLTAALARVNAAPLDIAARAEQIALRMAEAERQGADLLLFPQDVLTGVNAGDLAARSLRGLIAAQLLRLAGQSGRCLSAIPFPYHRRGVRYPAIALMRQGRLWHILLRSDAMDERGERPLRPFRIAWLEEGQALAAPCLVSREPLIPLRGVKLGFTLGNALTGCWRLQRRGAGLIIMLDAEPAQALWHPSIYLRGRSLSHNVGLLYCNAGEEESSTDAVYGAERLAAFKGRLIASLPAFSGESLLIARMDFSLSAQMELPTMPTRNPRRPYAPIKAADLARWCDQALEICARGLMLRLRRAGARTAILGLSGGLDSAMALLTARRALELLPLPPDRLMAWSLPCFGTSSRTRQNALRLMDALGLARREIDLSDAVSAHLKRIGHSGEPDTAYENAQARERSQVLMDLCNMHGGLMVGPGDMSELALGFTTYGGDHMSMYGVNAGLYKSAIRLILRHLADTSDNPALSAVLSDILDTPISPELLPGGQQAQQTEQLLGSYELNDFILWHVQEGHPPAVILREMEEVFGQDYDRDELKARLTAFGRRFVMNQFKRSCLPDGPSVFGHSLSPRGGFRMPSDASAAAWIHEIEGATAPREGKQ